MYFCFSVPCDVASPLPELFPRSGNFILRAFYEVDAGAEVAVAKVWIVVTVTLRLCVALLLRVLYAVKSN